MKTPRWFLLGPWALIIMLALLASSCAGSGSESDAGAETPSAPAVTLRAASGASILFRAQNGALDDGASRSSGRVPHLVLRRNGRLTDPEDRTLVVELNGITVPPPGVTVTLQVETQHGDPDVAEGVAAGAGGSDALDFLARASERRIPVWREARWIANPSRIPVTAATAVFRHTFDQTVISGTETIPTPTDYFRYDVSVISASHRVTGPADTGEGSRSASASVSGSRLASRSMSGDHAFLMENQWIARLPEVQEATEGAAPDELIVYYLDMVPFRTNTRDPATWLPRKKITDFVGTELVPQMVEAFRVQTDVWEFPWYEAWTSYRLGEDAERLSVALSDGRTWYHGRAPLRGHSGISIRVSGGDNVAYETLTDGLMSSFHHELFHNLQRNINQSRGGDGDIDGVHDVWRFFSEGTAVLASSVGQPDLQFRRKARSYMSKANAFMGYGGQFTDLKTSYEEMDPYHAALYWRFLYEQCGVTDDGSLEPAVGMDPIRRALTVLYSVDVVEITASTDLVGSLSAIMDRALSRSPCAFDTYAESLAAFTRALYALRLEGGRCEAPGSPAGCGFYDPHNMYFGPPISTVSYAGADGQHTGEIPSSFGVDFVDLTLDPAADGQPLRIDIQGTSGAAAEFAVQVWSLKGAGEGLEPQLVPTPTAAPKMLETARPGERVSYEIPAIDTAESDRVGLIITRVDNEERSDPVGAYIIFMR